MFNSRNLGAFGYAGLNPLNFIDPDGKELVRLIFENSAFSEPIIVDKTFIPVAIQMNEAALKRGIRIEVQASFRPSGAVLNNVVAGVTPAKRSKHYVGRAIDVNLVDKQGKWWHSKAFAAMRTEPKTPQEVVSRSQILGFLTELKSTEISTEIDRGKNPRWGGDFSTFDPVHFDLDLGREAWDKLYQENQKQYQCGDIPTYTVAD